MLRCFRISAADNVATLLDSGTGRAAILGEAPGEIELKSLIQAGHKVALTRIGEGSAVVKYGVSIGRATSPIAPGDWVHLHNCASHMDARSQTLDLQSGAATDTPYE